MIEIKANSTDVIRREIFQTVKKETILQIKHALDRDDKTP